MKTLTNTVLARIATKGLFTHSAPRTYKKDTRKAFQLEWLRNVSTLDTNEVFDELNTKRKGLSASEVELSRAAWGSNEVAHAHRDPVPLRFLKAFADPFTGILFCLLWCHWLPTFFSPALPIVILRPSLSSLQ